MLYNAIEATTKGKKGTTGVSFNREPFSCSSISSENLDKLKIVFLLFVSTYSLTGKVDFRKVDCLSIESSSGDGCNITAA